MYNIAGFEIDNITTTAGYSQLTNKPTHFVNGTSSCIDLIFTSNVSFTRNYEIERSIFTRNVITTLHMALLTSMYLYRHLIIEKFGIIKMQTLKVFKKQFQILFGLKHLGTRTQIKAVNY